MRVTTSPSEAYAPVQMVKLPAADVDDSVAEAVEGAYYAVSTGRRVGSIGA